MPKPRFQRHCGQQALATLAVNKTHQVFAMFQACSHNFTYDQLHSSSKQFYEAVLFYRRKTSERSYLTCQVTSWHYARAYWFDTRACALKHSMVLPRKLAQGQGLWAWQICTPSPVSTSSPTCWPWTNYPASLNLILLFACLTGLAYMSCLNEPIPGWMYPKRKNKQNQYCFKMNQYWIKMSVLPDLTNRFHRSA